MQALKGFGMDMMDVLFTQILGWNYTVTYYDYSWNTVRGGPHWSDWD